jgi:hypothetical protein
MQKRDRAIKLEAEQAERNGDYGKVAEIRYGKIKEKEKGHQQLFRSTGIHQRQKDHERGSRC